MNTSMYTSTELKEIIDNLEYMNDEDVKKYGFDTVEEAEKQLWEDYEEAVNEESENCYASNGFSGAYDYNSYRY